MVKSIGYLPVVLFAAVLEAQTTLTFNDLPNAYFFNGGAQNIGTYYSGITFGPNVTALSVSQFGGYDSAAFPPHSGNIVIWDATDATITITFAAPVQSFSIWYTALDPLMLLAYDQNNSLLGTVTGTPNTDGVSGSSSLIQYSNPAISTVHLSGTPGLFTLSVLTYLPAAASLNMPQTLTFGPLSDVTYGIAPFALSATASSGLPVSFASTTPDVCTVSGDIVTIVAPGTCSITAEQSGNSTYAPATSVTQPFTVLAPVCSKLSIIGNVSLGHIDPTKPFTQAVYTAQCGTPQYNWDPPNPFFGLTVSCSGANCTLSGTPIGPTEPNSNAFFAPLTVTDGANPSATATVVLVGEIAVPDSPPLAAASPLTDTATVGVSYLFTGFNAGVTGGRLPSVCTPSEGQTLQQAGLTLQQIGPWCAVTGVPTTPGEYTFDVQVTDQDNDPPVSFPLTVNVQAAGTPSGSSAQLLRGISVAGPRASTGSAPAINPGGVIDIAAYQALLTPGGIMSIYGINLADGVNGASSTPLPTSLGNVQVTVNGENAALFYVSSIQINFQAPLDPLAYFPLATPCLQTPLDPANFLPVNCPAPRPANVIVIRDGVPSAPISVPVATNAAAVLTWNGSFEIATHTNYQLITPASPAQAGEVIVIYGAGIGYPMCGVVTGFASGADCLANVVPQFTFPDYPSLNSAAGMRFAGLTPGAVGLAQFNLQLPASLPNEAIANGSIRMRIGDPVTGQTFNLYLNGGGGALTPASIQVVSGNNQAATVSQPFTTPLVVQVSDAQGNAITGANVSFTLTSGSAVIGTPTTTTNGSGQASTLVTAGSASGSVVITATAGLFSVQFSLKVNSGITYTYVGSVQVISGNNQTASVGQSFAAPLVVLVTDTQGNPMSGQVVSFTLTSGSAVIGTPAATTNSSGQASTLVTAGGSIGSAVITAAIASFTAQFSLNVATAPVVTPAGVVNGFSYLGGAVSPGEIVTIFGSNLGPGQPAQASILFPAPTTLAGVQVLFDGLPAPILFVSSSQIAAVTPFELSGSATTTMQVSNQGAVSSPVQLNVNASTPGLQTSSDPTQVQAFHANGSPISSSSQATPGESVYVELTGGGQLNPSPTDGQVNGQLANMVLPVTVSVGGMSALVVYAGALIGEFAGYDQIDFTIPTNAPSENLAVTVTVGGVSSQPGLTIPVQ